MKRILQGVVVAVMLVFMAGGAAAQEKYALVIGNGAYASVSPLKNPANDAADMAAALKGLGFQVDQLNNAGLDAMMNAVARLGTNLGRSPGATGFFFYAGHGVQSNGINYLIPVDANIVGESFLRNRALAAQEVLDTLQQAGNGLNIVVLDACRDNPFGWARSGNRGLVAVGGQPKGSIVVYATSAGSTAQDGTGRNGLFTSQLLKNLKTPGLEIKEVFNRTGADVMEASGNSQVPAVYSQFFKSAYLAGGPKAAPVNPTPAEPDFGTVTVTPGAMTVSVVTAGTLQIAGKSVAIAAGGTLPVNKLAPGDYPLTVTYPDGQSESATVTVTSGQSVAVGFSYRQAPPKPKTPQGFVFVQGGTFTMGSPASEAGRESWDKGNEKQHQVTVGSFSIGAFDVTVGDFRAFAQATGYRTSADLDGGAYWLTGSEWKKDPSKTWVDPGFSQGDRNPVVGVSWYDAVAYANWASTRDGLKPAYSRGGSTDVQTWPSGWSTKTNNDITCDFSASGYRLPTEAEWEYAARGGSGGSYMLYAGGNDIDAVAWYGRKGGDHTYPVGQKTANGLGLYDMSGNVWQWCWDWYQTDNTAGTSDPRGPGTGDYRVLRGGSWLNLATNVRVANRDNFDPWDRYAIFGFRLVTSQIPGAR